MKRRIVESDEESDEDETKFLEAAVAPDTILNTTQNPKSKSEFVSKIENYFVHTGAEILIVHKIHNFIVSFLTKFTFW